MVCPKPNAVAINPNGPTCPALQANPALRKQCTESIQKTACARARYIQMRLMEMHNAGLTIPPKIQTVIQCRQSSKKKCDEYGACCIFLKVLIFLLTLVVKFVKLILYCIITSFLVVLWIIKRVLKGDQSCIGCFATNTCVVPDFSEFNSGIPDIFENPEISCEFSTG